MLFTRADSYDKSVPEEGDNPLIVNNFEHECGAPGYAPTDGKLEVEELPSSGKENCDDRYATDINM